MVKNILITGGAGFLGRHLCNRLLQDKTNKVICIDNLITGHIHNIHEFLLTPNKRFVFIEKDITDDNFVMFMREMNINFDEIYHLACIASPPKYKAYAIETLMTSFMGTKNILDLARGFKSKMLFTSTSEVYGDPLVHPQPEDYFGNVNSFGERSCYDEGKRVAESLIYEYKRNYGLDIKIVRIFNTYGPYMDIDDGRVITNFIKQILDNKPLVIYGDGTQGRSFCYVDDMINGLYGLMNSIHQGPMNIGNPYTEFTLNELVTHFEELVEQKLEVSYIEATANDPKQRRPVIDKAITCLNWKPKIELKAGLEKTMEYFKRVRVE